MQCHRVSFLQALLVLQGSPCTGCVLVVQKEGEVWVLGSDVQEAG